MFQSKLLREASEESLLGLRFTGVEQQQLNQPSEYKRGRQNSSCGYSELENIQSDGSRLAAVESIEVNLLRRMKMSNRSKGEDFLSVLPHQMPTPWSEDTPLAIEESKERSVLVRLEEIKRRIHGCSSSSLPKALSINQKKTVSRSPSQSNAAVGSSEEQRQQLKVSEEENHRLRVQLKLSKEEVESNVKQLKLQIEAKEQRSRKEVTAMISELQKQQCEALERERQTRLSLSEQRTQFNQHCDLLQKQLQLEKKKSTSLEKKLEEMQSHYKQKVLDMAEITQKAKLQIVRIVVSNGTADQQQETSQEKMQRCIDEAEERMDNLRRRAEQEKEHAKQKAVIEWELKFAISHKELDSTKAALATLEKQHADQNNLQNINEKKQAEEISTLQYQVQTFKDQQHTFEANLQQIKEELSQEQTSSQQLLVINRELQEQINSLQPGSMSKKATARKQSAAPKKATLKPS